MATKQYNKHNVKVGDTFKYNRWTPEGVVEATGRISRMTDKSVFISQDFNDYRTESRDSWNTFNTTVDKGIYRI